MFEIKKAIEIYANKKIDFYNEVELCDDGNGVYIKKWNVGNILKPSMIELQIAYSNNIETYDLQKQFEKNEDDQLQQGLQYLKYNFDKFRETILKCSLLESRIIDKFNNMFIDNFTNSNNIDLVNSNNIELDKNKGIIKVSNIKNTGIIVTNTILITSSGITRFRVRGEGLVAELNWGMIVSVSINDGLTWDELTMTSPLSDIYTFDKPVTTGIKLKMEIIPRGIYPDSEIMGIPYLTIYGVLY